MAGRHKKFYVNRCSLSPFTETAINQLLPEVWRNCKNKKTAMRQLRRIRDMVEAHMNNVFTDDHTWKKKKQRIRSPEDAARRALIFEQIKAGTYVRKADRIVQQVDDSQPS